MTKSQTVLITGASSGFGRGLVSAFLESGWTVLATLRDAESRKSLFAADQEQYGDRLALVSLDVADARQRDGIQTFVHEKFSGQLDCLINNAGYGVFGALEDLSEEQIRKQMEVNFFGVVFLTQALLPSLRKAKGRVINLSSVLGFLTVPVSSLYCASKFALEGFTETISHELSKQEVQVCLVEPGGFATRFTENMNWGVKSLSPDSPYYSLTQAFARSRDKRGGGKGDPQEVVRAILRVAQMKKMPIRIRCGKDCQAGFLAKTFLFGNLFSNFTKWIFQREMK